MVRETGAERSIPVPFHRKAARERRNLTSWCPDGRPGPVPGRSRPDYADVTLFFEQLNWIAANEPAAAFDLNGNDRMDFDDIVRLFQEVV
jgi:hypothetical protein